MAPRLIRFLFLSLSAVVARFQKTGQGFVGFLVAEQRREAFVHGQSFQRQVKTVLFPKGVESVAETAAG